MELPISKPSRVSYADELEFSKLLEELERKKHNGFIRVTHGSEEGYILFNEGNQIAASYDQHMKIDAIDKIKSVMDKVDTLIEVFDLKPTQIDYIKDLNKVYLISEDSEVYNMIEELKGKKIAPSSEIKASESLEEVSKETESKIVSPEPETETVSGEAEKKPETEVINEVAESERTVSEIESEPDSENLAGESEPEVESEVFSQVEEPLEPNKNTGSVSEDVKQEPESQPEIYEEPSKPAKDISESETVSELEQPDKTEIEKTEIVSDESEKELESQPEINKKTSKPENVQEAQQASELEKTSETKLEESKSKTKEPVSREVLMKKYGLKEVNEEEVENILESYKGGTISIEDLERIELTLMNKIKKSIMGIPKIKGVEVMVFLDNVRELTGTINIITEYGGTGFLSRIVGSSDKIKLENRIYTITEMEIKKSFREYPEIINNFEINIEIH
ncbi:MAG: DUF2226 domain-containing protein [Methanobacteriaceae archaeon]|nr:DUF2226 domain-containing protein [Methanobacteriaceae archaeon]